MWFIASLNVNRLNKIIIVKQKNILYFLFEQRMPNANKFASTIMYHNVNLNNDCSVIL
jgi:hypothetical protein